MLWFNLQVQPGPQPLITPTAQFRGFALWLWAVFPWEIASTNLHTLLKGMVKPGPGC